MGRGGFLGSSSRETGWPGRLICARIPRAPHRGTLDTPSARVPSHNSGHVGRQLSRGTRPGTGWQAGTAGADEAVATREKSASRQFGDGWRPLPSCPTGGDAPGRERPPRHTARGDATEFWDQDWNQKKFVGFYGVGVGRESVWALGSSLRGLGMLEIWRG